MCNLKRFASVTTLLALTTGAALVEARPGTPTDPRVTLVGPTEVDIHFRNTAGSELVVFEIEMQLDGKRVDPNVERTISQNLGGMYGNGERSSLITSKMLGGLLGPGIEFCFRAWSRTRVRNEGYLPTDNILSEIPSAWACAVPLPNKPPQPQEVSTYFKACALEVGWGRPCKPGFTDRTVGVRWLIPAFPYGTTIDRVVIERSRYRPDATPWEVDYAKDYVIRYGNNPFRGGEHLRPPKQPGSYQYRVCLENAAGRECSIAVNTLTFENPSIQGVARTPGVVVPEQATPRTTATVHELDNPNIRRAREIAATNTPPPPPPDVNPNGTTATAVAVESRPRASSARIDPSGPVTLNPQPLPPKATVLQPRAPTVLTVPTQPTHHSSSSVVSGGQMSRYATPQGQIQGAARSPVTGPAAIATEELVCRGGPAIRIDKAGEKQTPDGTAVLLTLYFQTTSSSTTDKFGRGLPPSTCSFIGRTWVPTDPPGVRFETSSRTSVERDIKRALHGSSAPTAGASDAERRADELSIPAYLSNPSHYWGFTVAKGHGYFVASRHGFVKTTFVPAEGRAADTARRTTVVRLHNVQVRPGIASARFRFIARPGAAPTVDISRQPPVTGRDGLKVLPDQMTMPVDLEPAGDSESPLTWYTASTKDKGIRLDEEIDYHYVVTVPGDEKVAIQQSSGRFKTLREPIVLKVTFRKLHVIDDSDDLSDGEGAFTYCVGFADQVQEMPAFASGTDVPANREFVDGQWRDGPIEIAVQGIEDDAFGRLLRNNCYVDGPVSDATGDRNVARIRIDTSSPLLSGRHGSRAYEMRSPDGRLAFSVQFVVDISRPAR